MQTPASPVYSDNDAGEFPMDVSPHHPGQQAHAHRRGANRIDYTKFKTKMCRHYLQGMCCPFRERCAFSHGDEEPTSPVVMSPVDGGSESQYMMMRGDFPEEDGHSGDGSSECAVLPPPPSYECAMIAEEEYALPPAYPTRYRFDPYSYSGIQFEYKE